MKQQLSVVSRILVAFASGALVTVFFLPAWRIDLFAPQYPEGLTMNIWINGLSGDVDVINGLNHYIGMKHITPAMFPEFRFLPWVVGFFMALGMLVAITGKRKLLLAYLGLTVIGGALAMYDFYKWGYDYGHNLDPTAPIQVPGLSYQPPLFGHKRLLNFDAYSFPDVGGWIVIGAAALAFGVWFAEWWHHRRKKNNYALPVLSLVLLLLSCSTKPEPFNYGKDTCYLCKMGISDPKFGGEIVTKKGKIYKFDDLVCMNRFLRTGTVPAGDISKTLTILFNGGGFAEVQSASFVYSPDMRSPMGGNTAAFPDSSAARQWATANNGQVMNWNAVSEKLR